MKRFFLLFFVIVFFQAISLPLQAEIKTFTKEYVYRAGKEDGKSASRVIALREAKHLLLEELVASLEGETGIKSLKLTKDQRMAIAAVIAPTEVIAEKWEGVTYRISLKIDVDPADAVKSMAAIYNDPEKRRALEELRIRSEELLQINKKLKKDLLLAKGKKRKLDKEIYLKTIHELTSIDWAENGYAHANSGKYEQAIKDFDKVIELDAKDFNAYYNRGTAYAQLRRYPQALQDFNSAVALKPAFAPVLMKRGFAYFSMGQHDQAVQDFDRAIAVDPKSSEGYNARGIVNANRGKFNEAIKDFDRAVELSPRFVSAFMNRGLAYYNNGKYDESIQNFTKAVDLDPKLTVTHLYLGLAHTKLGKYNQAIGDYETAIKLDAKLSVAYYNLARIYASRGDDKQALENLKTALQINPGLKAKAGTEADFEKIRQQPEYIELIGPK